MAEERMLSGILAVDLTRWIAGPYLTRLLAALGARVVKVETPAGDLARRLPAALGPQDSGLFQQLNAGKESVCLDLEQRRERQRLRELVARADVFVHDLAPPDAARLGISHRSLARRNPGLIMCSLTGFGQEGPLRDWEGSGGVAAALSGARDPAGDPEGPPQGLWGDIAAATAGTHGLSAVLAALYARGRGGPGQHLDISLLDCLFGTIEIAVQQHLHSTREGKALPQVPRRSQPYRTRNGDYVVINPYNEAILRRFTVTMGNPGLADDPAFDTFVKRVEHADAFHAIVQAWFGAFESAGDVLPLLHAARVPAAPVATTEQAWRDTQLRQRGMFAPVPHPARGLLELPNSPLRSSVAETGLRGPAPALGQHTEAVLAELPGLPLPPSAPRRPGVKRRSPFQDVRVLDFTRVLAGPYLARHLHDLGAQVIKVESATFPDNGRHNMAFFCDFSHSKLGAGLNLKTETGQLLLQRLVAASDVVIENYAVGVAERIGIDYQRLRRVRSDLILVHLPALGQWGPSRDWVALGPNLMAFTGMTHLWSHPDATRPVGSQTPYPDYVAASHSVVAVLAALHHRARTGQGCEIELAQAEATAAVLGPLFAGYLVNGEVPQPMGNASPVAAPHGCFRCQGDDAWCTVAVETEEHWRAFGRALGEPTWTRDSRFATAAGRLANREELDRLVEEWTANYTPRQVMWIL
ncbi:MAG: CoA transferase, partial [Chloroflexi bacterium]|nr:CoA transferase [Chloroflexota bacterium]